MLNFFQQLPRDAPHNCIVNIDNISLISSFQFATPYHKCVDGSYFVLLNVMIRNLFHGGKRLCSLTLMFPGPALAQGY